MSEQTELRHRVEAKKRELQARLARLRAEGTSAANDAAKSLEKSLTELESYLRQGWDNLTETVASKLNDWLEKRNGA